MNLQSANLSPVRSFPVGAWSRRAALGLWLAGCATVALAQAAAPDALPTLASFIKSTHSGRANFTQVLTAPARDGQAARSKTSSGTFEFLRPNRFKFSYKKPFEQTIVADGQTLWLHDLDLNQVTARKLSQVLQGTPAAVIAAASDLRGLEADFALQAQPEVAGVQWVQATPKSKDGQLQNIRVGLRPSASGVDLVALEILDSFGQRSVMSFSQFETNPSLPAGHFAFKPPAGADVIRP